MMKYSVVTEVVNDAVADVRQVEFVSPLRIEFNSNGFRKRRGITFAEKARLEQMIAERDYAAIDLFCYSIV